MLGAGAETLRLLLSLRQLSSLGAVLWHNEGVVFEFRNQRSETALKGRCLRPDFCFLVLVEPTRAELGPNMALACHEISSN